VAADDQRRFERVRQPSNADLDPYRLRSPPYHHSPAFDRQPVAGTRLPGTGCGAQTQR
jgi:hypothetical protein